jgi:hypothetical protein
MVRDGLCSGKWGVRRVCVCVLWERGEQEEYRRGGPVSLPVNKRRGDITQHLILCLQLHSYSVLD